MTDTLLTIAAAYLLVIAYGFTQHRRSPWRWPWRLTRGAWRMIQRMLRIRPSAVVEAAQSKGFYSSRAWQTARIKCFERNMRENNGLMRCELCGQMEIHGVTSWHCHHVKSRSRWPELALDPDNLAALCSSCNLGCSNRYEDLKLNRCSRKYG